MRNTCCGRTTKTWLILPAVLALSLAKAQTTSLNWIVDNGGFTVTSNSLRETAKGSDYSASAHATLQNEVLSFQVDFTNPPEGGRGEHQMSFWITDDKPLTNACGYKVDLYWDANNWGAPTDYMSLFRVDNGTNTAIVSGSTTAILRDSAKHRIRLNIYNGRVWVELDSVTVSSVNDNRYSNLNRVSINSYMKYYSVDAIYENIFVSGATDFGLLAYYPFDGTAQDASGNGNHATLHNTASYVSGTNNQAIHLQGRGHTGTDGDYVTFPGLALDTRPAFTVSLWVKHDGYAGLWDHGQAYIAFGRQYATALNISFGGTPWSFGYSGSNKGVSVPSDGTEWGNWIHHALTFSGGTLSAYKNGVLVGSSTGVIIDSVTQAGLNIAWFNSGGTESTRFIGSIDDVRIYSRAISASEIARLAGVGEAGLVAYYPLNGNANDLGGRGYQGVATNTLIASDRNGILGNALCFNGSNAFVEVTDCGDLDLTNAFTVTAWTLWNGTAESAIVSKSRPCFGSGYSLRIKPDGHAAITLNNDPGRDGGNHNLEVLSANILSSGQWHFVSGVFDGSTAKIYVDGSICGSGSWPWGSLLNSSYPFYIGRESNFAYDIYHDGIIDDVRVYDRALSSKEVSLLAGVVKTVTVRFDPQGGTVEPSWIDQSSNDPYWALPTPSRTGYAFNGWFTNAVCSGLQITNGTDVIIASNHTLYASWTLTHWIGVANTNWYTGVASSYSVSNEVQMAGVAKLVNAGVTNFARATVTLANGLNLSNLQWTAIGDFHGTFDGGGKIISGVLITNTIAADYQGLFGAVGSGGIIRNVNLVGTDIRGLGYVGGIAGFVEGTVVNCINEGMVGGDWEVGGVAGVVVSNGTVANCQNRGTVRGNWEVVGGVAGAVWGGTVVNCQNNGRVEGGRRRIGGIVGYFGDGAVVGCRNSGIVSGTDYEVGGVVGFVENGMLVNCGNCGEVIGGWGVVGGVAGAMFGGTVVNNQNSGVVNGGDWGIGGVAGYVGEGLLANCLNIGAITGNVEIGGVAGYGWSGVITNCYWKMDGTVGFNWDTTGSGLIPDCRSFGAAPGYFTDGITIGGNPVTTNLLDALNQYVNAANVAVPSVRLLNWAVTPGVNGGYPDLIPPAAVVVTFHPDGGTLNDGAESGQETYYEGHPYWFFPWVARDGYAFIGWTNVTGAVMSTASNATATASDLYALWAPLVPVSFNGGGGTFEDGYGIAVRDYAVGYPYGSLPPDPTRGGWAFKNWTNSEGVVMTGASNATASVTDLYASWTLTHWIGIADTNWYTGVASSYSVSNEVQMAGVAKLVNAGVTNFAGVRLSLANGLNLSNLQWTAIGGFRGTFDGGGRQISGVTITNGPQTDVLGFFGIVESGGSVRNVSLTGTDILGNDSIGSVAGRVDGGSLANCQNSGRVWGNSNVGGVAGYINGGSLANCMNCGEVGGNVNVGGVAGNVGSGSVVNSYWKRNGLSGYDRNVVGSGAATNCRFFNAAPGYFTNALIIGANAATTNLLKVLNQHADATNATNPTVRFMNWTVRSDMNSGYPCLAVSITFHANRGQFAGGQTITNLLYIQDGSYGTLPIPARTNYAFVGWWTKPNGQGDPINHGTRVNILASQTFYAYWVPCHPADLNCDLRMTMQEAVLYRSAWLNNEAWPVMPTPIPETYVIRATELWKGGEVYHFVTGDPPSCWQVTEGGAE